MQAASSAVVWADGIEDRSDNGLGAPINPELRAFGVTPLAGAARTAATWYNAIKLSGQDSHMGCRPYVLIEITDDGVDTCDSDPTSPLGSTVGPVAATQGFVAATVSGAQSLNRVFVISVKSQHTTVLDAMARAGGTGSVRTMPSSQDLGDLVSEILAAPQCN